ncbi:MAG: PEP/pyruvate-binding domain-containing protein [Patescibacteria group bacterium]|nr:hypothetical protein [Patescibacteria group bacterium]
MEDLRSDDFDASKWKGSCSRIDDPRYVEYWKRFYAEVGHVDIDKVRRDTLVYGAKGANLDVLAGFISKIVGFDPEVGHFEVPEYIKIPVDVFIKWRNGEDIVDDLRPYYEWAKGKEVVLRSSAVFSEDGDDRMGPGLYESIDNSGRSFEKFIEDIIKVFSSVDNPEAVRYREELGIKDELMGIVVQENVADFEDVYYDKCFFSVDSTCCQVPRLIRATDTANGTTGLIYKDVLESQLVSSEFISLDDEKLYHCMVDGQLTLNYEMFKTALLSLYLERYYGRGVQIESRAGDKGGYLLQVRPLPWRYFEENNVEFPEGDCLYRGRAVGVGDMVLDVLDNRPDNREKEGVVVMVSDCSMGDSYGRNVFYWPKRGGLILLSPPSPMKAHLESLCAEKGILCIASKNVCSLLPGQLDEDGLNFLSKINSGVLSQVRMVLNGVEGRVYEV